MSDKINPYASPQTFGDSPTSLVEPWCGTYLPVVMSRDVVDGAIVGGFGFMIALPLYGIPIGTLFLLQAPVWSYFVAVFTVVGIALLAIAVGIQRVDLTPEGIKAKRLILPALRLAWSEVRSVENVGRFEALLMTAFQPHRCCSYSFTARDQVRVRGPKFSLLFPPRNPATYFATIVAYTEQHRPRDFPPASGT